MPIPTNTIQRSFGSPSNSNQRIKRNKINSNWKRRIKLSLLADDMIFYIENPKDATRKLLELINEYSKVAGYKLNTQKFLAFLYASERSKREIKETIPFTIATKKIKYLGINSSKETKDQYTENCKTLIKDLKDDTNRWRNILFLD